MKKQITQLLTCLILLVLSTGLVTAQSSISGTITDDGGEALIGATILLKGTTTGTITNLDGEFTLGGVEDGSHDLVISYTGYTTKELDVTVLGATNIGVVRMAAGIGLSEVTVSGVMDIAVSRQTPVAVSTIPALVIRENLGTQEFPEILNTTPSVYATKGGGGFGDSRINIRGFDQKNTAVLINGVPVNDMENGWVYWSNWAGLSDVTSAIQVQRGLGSSKLAISSVGGTINVITRTADQQQGGTIGAVAGNDGYLKFQGAYNTGIQDNGFSASLLFSNTSGDGYVDGTKFNGNNYFIAMGYKPNDDHSLQWTFTGAPQWHHQRSFAPGLRDYIGYNADNDGEPDIKYNGDWGMLRGEEYSFRRNFYHKPVMSVNWDWNVSPSNTLSTVIYGSWGRGGGTGEIGRVDGKRQYDGRLKTAEGLVDVDLISNYNMGNTVVIDGDTVTRTMTNGQFVNTGSGDRSSANGISRRASMNSHNWYGTVVNLNNKLNDVLTMDIGVEARIYEGIHYRTLNDLLDGDIYLDDDNMNDPDNFVSELIPAEPSANPFQSITDQPRIDYNNDGLVNWYGAFGQLEYSENNVSAFIQGGASNQGFKRIEYFNELPADQETDYENILGGNIKGGVNFNVDANNNIYVNGGYYSKQPLFDAVYLNFGNNLNPDLTNEKIVGMELGYGYRSSNFDANVNVYRTSWKDRFSSESTTFTIIEKGDTSEVRGNANLLGIEQVHMGVELDGVARNVGGVLDIFGMVSVGSWEYGNDVVATYLDEDQNPIMIDGEEQVKTLYLDGVKVGDAAQMTARLGGSAKVADGLKIDASWRYVDNLYADISAEDFDSEDHDGSLKLPSHGLVDAGIGYFMGLNNGEQGLSFRVNVNNVLDKQYISESHTNIHAEEGDETWEGVHTSNRVFFGWGRTWNAAVRFEF